MKKIFRFLIPLFVFLILVMPVVSLAQPAPTPLVPCTNTPGADGKIPDNQLCDFNAFLHLINKVIRFALFTMAVPIAAIMFFYAGFLLITAGDEAAGARTKAKSIFTNALIGLVVAVAAWLIVRTVLMILGYDGVWIGFPR